MKKFLLLLTLFLSLAGIAKATETTVTFGTLYSSVTSNQSLKDKSFDVDNVVTFTFGGSGNATQYYNNGKNVRIYQNNTITVKVSEGYAVTKIAFTGVSGNAFHSNFKPSIGTCPANGNNATWSGNLSDTGTLTFTNSGTQIRCTDVTVTYEPVHKNLGDITVSYSGVDVTENSTVSVPNGTVFNIAAENATSITINGTETSGATATYTATTSETVNVSATDGSNTKEFIFTTDVYEAPAAPTFTIEGEATDNADEYYIGAKLAITATGTIRYTLDGTTIPTAEVGTLYNGEIELPLGETIVKAVAYDAGNHCGALTEKAYKVIKYTPEISWSEAEAEATLGKDFTAPTLSVTDGLTVSYVSSKPEVASITADGVVTPLAMGVTTITATTTETDKYTSISASYSLKVVDPNVKLVVDKFDHTSFEGITSSYSTLHYTSATTGITYAACTNYNSSKSGMTLNSQGKGKNSKYDPGFGVSENHRGLIAKKITVKYAETISPSVRMLIVPGTETGFDVISFEDATSNGTHAGHVDAWATMKNIGADNVPSIATPVNTSDPLSYTFEESERPNFFALLVEAAHYIDYVEVEWLMPATPEVTMVEDNTNNTITVTVNHADYILHYKKIHNNNWNNHWGSEAANAPARVAQDTTGEPLADSEDWVSTGTNTITIDKTIADHQNRHYKFTAFHKDDTALANELNHVNFLIDGDGTLTGIEGIGAEAGADAPAEYYDLQGRRVANPVSGLYIRRTGSKVEKVFVK